jgi:hypothetical protein
VSLARSEVSSSGGLEPKLLIRSSGQVAHDRPVVSAYWAANGTVIMTGCQA